MLAGRRDESESSDKMKRKKTESRFSSAGMKVLNKKIH